MGNKVKRSSLCHSIVLVHSIYHKDKEMVFFFSLLKILFCINFGAGEERGEFYNRFKVNVPNTAEQFLLLISFRAARCSRLPAIKALCHYQ